MTKQIAVIGGDGIGPEVVNAVLSILHSPALKLSDLEYTPICAGYEYFKKNGECISEKSLEICKAADAVFYGANTNPPGETEYKSLTLSLRKELGLFANIRPAVSLPIPTSREGIDITIFRENSEGLYVQREREVDGGVIAERVVTRAASERIIREAFLYAQRLGKTSVTLVHKANVLKKSCGLFREVGFEVAGDFPEVEVREMLVDAAAMELIRNPTSFDVIATTNLFGDILSDEASALVGGLGMAPSANIGERNAMFEPVHGSAPDIAGQGVANPCAAILSACMMLEYLGYSSQAQGLRNSLTQLLRDGVRTPDLKGECSTEEFVSQILSCLI